MATRTESTALDLIHWKPPPHTINAFKTGSAIRLHVTLRVAELFAGVGGFRHALERLGDNYEVVWSNQWEPSRKRQHASECYIRHFGNEGHHCVDINTIEPDEIQEDIDLLVGGFPCQDYSRPMATRTDGINGKKGQLWWCIADLLSAKKPSYALLENVDLLLRSPAKAPAKRRGRDLALVLSSFHANGYNVEWRVINAADYGYPQKRRRVFFFAARHETTWGSAMAQAAGFPEHFERLGFFAREFKAKVRDPKSIALKQVSVDLPRQKIEDEFRFDFENAGVMAGGVVWTARVDAVYDGPRRLLKDVLEEDVDEKYYATDDEIDAWKIAKGPKEKKRTASNGFKYVWKEGRIPFPDEVNAPSRTMTTSEGGRTPTRSKHIIREPGSRKLRRLTPLEAERLNGFPDGWTAGMPEGWRYYCMGNALVVGLVEKMGKTLALPDEKVLKGIEKPVAVSVQSRLR